MVLLLLLLLFIWPSYADASRYWVDPSGNDANSCATVKSDTDPGTYKLTIVSAKACMTGGDTLTVKAGTYTGTNNQLNNIPSGLSSSNPTIIEGDPSSPAGCAILTTCLTIINNNGTYGINFGTSSYVTLRNLKMVGSSNLSYAILVGDVNNVVSTTGNSIINVESTLSGNSNGASGIMNAGLASFTLVDGVNLHDDGNFGNGHGHGFYQQGDDVTVRNSWIHNNANYGLQCYNSGTESDSRPDRCHVYNNVIENNGNGGLALEGIDDQVVGNVIRNNANGITSGYDSAANLLIYNNYVDKTISIGTFGTASNAVVRNNVVIGSVTLVGGTNLTSDHNACRAADSCGTSKLTITAVTDIFTSSTDYTLKAGSSAIDAGTTSISAHPCNGTCDIGPNEAFTFSSGSITANTASVVLGMSGNTPPTVTSAGYTLNCTPNPTACPSPSITGLIISVGASSTLSITYSGTACAAGQIWTITYNRSTGATTDAVGLLLKQPMSGFTTQPLTNGCTGSGGPSPPGSPTIYYKFDDGSGTTATDSSGNGNTGTLTNTPAWVSGFSMTGVQTTVGTSQYVAIPYGSGVNPSTQSLTVAFWVYVTPGTAATASIPSFGASVGTNQRDLIQLTSGTWRIGIQGSNAGTPSDLSAVDGWNRLCLVMDSSIDTATLSLNGTASNSAGGKKTYTSYTLASNFKLGLYDINTAATAIYDNFKLWTSAIDCAQDYAAEAPPSTPWTGTISAVAFKFRGAKTDFNGSLVPLGTGALSENITIPASGYVALEWQMDGTGSDPTAIGTKLIYTCAACPSAGSELSVPDTASIDGIEFWGSVSQPGLLSGDPGSRLSGALTYVAGNTNTVSTSVPIFDLSLNSSTVQRWIIHIVPGTAQGRVFCMKPKEQTNVALNSYTPSGGACVTVGPPLANSGP